MKDSHLSWGCILEFLLPRFFALSVTITVEPSSKKDKKSNESMFNRNSVFYLIFNSLTLPLAQFAYESVVCKC